MSHNPDHVRGLSELHKEEAMVILWSFDVAEICEVIRFGLLSYETVTLLYHLRRRHEKHIIDFCEARGYDITGSSDHYANVEVFVRNSTAPSIQPTPWTWCPSDQVQDAPYIAREILHQSQKILRNLNFEEVVRASLGLQAPIVEEVLRQHAELYSRLRRHLQEYPDRVSIYIEVEKLLRAIGSFAHEALAQCILTVETGMAHTMPQNDTMGFAHIAVSIQNIFYDRSSKLSRILKLLVVLTVRFQHLYICSSKPAWNRGFDTNVLPLEHWLDSKPPKDLANTLIEDATTLFGDLSLATLLGNREVLSKLSKNWRTLSLSVRECCSAHPQITSYLQDCAQILYNAQDYHSLMALLIGITGSQCQKDILDGSSPAYTLPSNDLIVLANPAQNYGAYRRHYEEHSGIPFLIPHL